MEKPVRIMPCLGMRNGRVAKGVHLFHFGPIRIEELMPYLRQRGVAAK
jgi:hypothetical protein